MRCGLPWLTMTMTLIFLLSGLQPAIAAGTVYVDDETCPSTGSGTLGDPYCAIQDAIDSAIDGDLDGSDRCDIGLPFWDSPLLEP